MSTSAENLKGYDLFMLIHVYDLWGASNKFYYPLLDKVVENINTFGFDKLHELFDILYKRIKDERFTKAVLSVKQEIEKYNSNGERK